MNKTVDIYLPLDSRKGPNEEIWPTSVLRLTIPLLSLLLPKKLGRSAKEMNISFECYDDLTPEDV